VISEFFYRTHDPTTLNSQGADHGTRKYTPPYPPTVKLQRNYFLEYRSAIFYNSPSQKDIAQRVTEEVQKKHFDPHGTKITTQVVKAGKWFDAEDYHQLYLFKNPTGYQCPSHTLHW